MVYDLFGSVAVTLADARLWVKHLGIQPNTRRADWYVRAHDVVEKIKQAKIARNWPP